MSTSPYRWMMTGVAQPMVKEPMEIGTLEPGEVLVAIAGCGVCHTDLDYYFNGVRTNQPLPLAPATGAACSPAASWMLRLKAEPEVSGCGAGCGGTAGDAANGDGCCCC